MKKEADSRIDATPGTPPPRTRQQGCAGPIGLSGPRLREQQHMHGQCFRDMRHGLAASLARQIDMSSLALICGAAEEAHLKGMQQKTVACCWAASGGREKILIKGSSMKGVLSKQHSLVVLLGGVA